LKELKDIVKAFDLAQGLNKKTALATVVLVEGSSYRRAGARMLITEDGQLTGAISGGCLEGDALRKARMVIFQQKPMLVTYDTTDEDDAKFGVQLGCNGIIHVLIEPINPDLPDNPVNLFKLFFSKREPGVIITIFNLTDRHDVQYGTCLYMNAQGQTTGSLPGTIGGNLLKDAGDVLQNGNTFTRTYIDREGYTCFIELLQPEIALVVVGAGNDAMPLIQMAKVLGWNLTLIDGRPNYNTSERFPLADKLITAKPDEVVSHLSPDYRTVIVLMTHNFNYDSALLANLIPLDLPYIGVLGPKKRLHKMLEEIGGEDAETNYVNIHGPAGLDIGSEAPEQIALSILAEIQGVLNKLSCVPLRNKLYIHDRANEQVIQTLPVDNI
jgi:xanthine/CO dehydrogenase XdhC/CoxF family maturation factor